MFLRTSPGRGHKASKAFLVIFVCLSTRAVHLDVAFNYSAEAIITAFQKFVSRRGLCSKLFSDCGTNFVGADKELRRLFTASSKEGKCIAAAVANTRVRWRFNLLAAPHLGAYGKQRLRPQNTTYGEYWVTPHSPTRRWPRCCHRLRRASIQGL